MPARVRRGRGCASSIIGAAMRSAAVSVGGLILSGRTVSAAGASVTRRAGTVCRYGSARALVGTLTISTTSVARPDNREMVRLVGHGCTAAPDLAVGRWVGLRMSKLPHGRRRPFFRATAIQTGLLIDPHAGVRVLVAGSPSGKSRPDLVNEPGGLPTGANATGVPRRCGHPRGRNAAASDTPRAAEVAPRVSPLNTGCRFETLQKSMTGVIRATASPVDDGQSPQRDPDRFAFKRLGRERRCRSPCAEDNAWACALASLAFGAPGLRFRARRFACTGLAACLGRCPERPVQIAMKATRSSAAGSRREPEVGCPSWPCVRLRAAPASQLPRHLAAFEVGVEAAALAPQTIRAGGQTWANKQPMSPS